MDADKTKQRIREYLSRELGDERDQKIQAIENVSRVGEYHGLEIWARFTSEQKHLYNFIG